MTEEFLEFAFHSLSDGVIVCDANGKILLLNQAVRAFIGTSETDLSIEEWQPNYSVYEKDGVTLLKPEDDPLLKALRGEHLIDHEFIVINAKGERKIVVSNARQIRNSEGEILGAILVHKDVTEARKAELAKAQFMANISHEIRTPLHGISAVTESLAASGETSEQKEQLAILGSSVRRLECIVNDILDFETYEGRDFKVESRALDIGELSKHVALNYTDRFSSAGLSLNCTVQAPVGVQFFGDANLLKRAIKILTENALKFTHLGGATIHIAGRFKTESEAQIEVSVSDTGIGIAPATLSGLFSSFTQADSSTTKKYEGVGLGLALLERIMKTLGGTIEVESTPESGSVFTLVIPAKFEIKTPTEIVVNPPHRSSVRILVVEDSPTNQKLALLLLGKLGYRADVAANGQIGFDLHVRSPYDFILMDCQMPVMDGYASTRSIRAHEEVSGRHTPIVALTANAMPGDRDKCLEAGMDEYLSKPTRSKDLAGLIQTLVKRAA